MSGNLTSVSDSLGNVPNENIVTTGDGDQLIDGLLGLLERLFATKEEID